MHPKLPGEPSLFIYSWLYEKLFAWNAVSLKQFTFMFKEWNMLENNFPSFTDGVIKWKKYVYKNTAPLQLKTIY